MHDSSGQHAPFIAVYAQDEKRQRGFPDTFTRFAVNSSFRRCISEIRLVPGSRRTDENVVRCSFRRCISVFHLAPGGRRTDENVVRCSFRRCISDFHLVPVYAEETEDVLLVKAEETEVSMIRRCCSLLSIGGITNMQRLLFRNLNLRDGRTRSRFRSLQK